MDVAGVPFEVLANAVAAHPRFASLPPGRKLRFYGLYKAVRQPGELPRHSLWTRVRMGLRPGGADAGGLRKWQAWRACAHLDSHAAATGYERLARDLQVWPDEEQMEALRAACKMQGGARQKGWVGVSTMRSMQSVAADEAANGASSPAGSASRRVHAELFDAAAAADLQRMQLYLQHHGGDVPLDLPNEEGLCLAHIAADRGHLHILEWLAGNGADMAVRDRDGNTPLWYAKTCDEQECVRFLSV